MAELWTRARSLLFGAALGRASSDAITPQLEPVRQRAWSRNKVRVLDLSTLGELAAKGFGTTHALADEAARSGYDVNRLDAVMALAQSYPGLAELDRMSNRNAISDELVNKALSRHGIPGEYQPAVKALFRDLLSVSDVANAVQQGHLPNPDILPTVGTGTTPARGAADPATPDDQPPTDVPLTTIDLDPIEEASGQGIDLDRLKVLANLAGLPPGPETLLAMWNRGFITEEAVDAGIREGHLKTKWTGAFKRFRWAVLSGQEYAEARLRDWVTDAEMYAGGALTGHTKDQMDLFYKNRGRTATPRQIWLGIARKIVAPDYPDEPANGRLTSEHDHELAIRRSNIRPEYAPLLYDIRFNYPPLFQLNRLVDAGAVKPEVAKTWAEYNLYAPEVVEALHEFWTAPKAGKGSPFVAKAQTQLWTTAHASYKAEESSRGATAAALDRLDVSAADQEMIFALWDEERALIRAQLSPSDLRKAFQEGIVNPATGFAWTQDEAHEQLLERGWSADDATTYLTTPYKG